MGRSASRAASSDGAGEPISIGGGAMLGLTGQRTLMRIHLGERDKYQGRPVYQVIVELLRSLHYAKRPSNGQSWASALARTCVPTGSSCSRLTYPCGGMRRTGGADPGDPPRAGSDDRWWPNHSGDGARHCVPARHTIGRHTGGVSEADLGRVSAGSWWTRGGGGAPCPARLSHAAPALSCDA